MHNVFSSLQEDVDYYERMQSLNTGNPTENGIQDFFLALHTLFENLSLIAKENEESDTKFNFINAYPDETYDGFSNTVTFDVISRCPFKVDNKTLNTNKTSFIKPRYITDEYNKITGNVEGVYAIVFSNIISINCFSNKSRTLNNMVSLIESIFYKYSSYIKKHVDQFYYIGTGAIQFISKNDQNDRLFSKELQFHVVTSEFFSTEQEQLKSIDIKNKHN